MSSVPIFAVRLVREGRLSYDEVGRRPTVRTPGDAARILRDLVGYYDREAFAVLFLNTQNRCTGAHIAAVGTLDSAPIHPREIFKAAILDNAAAVILGHNHPSGRPEPSGDDLRITAKLQGAGKVLGIEVLDHIITGADGAFVSLRERGTLDALKT